MEVDYNATWGNWLRARGVVLTETILNSKPYITTNVQVNYKGNLMWVAGYSLKEIVELIHGTSVIVHNFNTHVHKTLKVPLALKAVHKPSGVGTPENKKALNKPSVYSYRFEVRRIRPSVTQGEVQIYINGKHLVTWGDNIQLGGTFGEVLQGWGSIVSDQEYIAMAMSTRCKNIVTM